jgi:uncharacterized cupredoxin-like copper-binding protein
VTSGCGGGAAADDGAGVRVVLDISYSAFELEEMTVPAGVPVTVVIRNNDPIAHEWIVGNDDLHAVHRTGTEAVHDERPSEVTVGAYAERATTLTFDEPGEYAYICHLPGHEAYGMVGTLVVTGES